MRFNLILVRRRAVRKKRRRRKNLPVSGESRDDQTVLFYALHHASTVVRTAGFFGVPKTEELPAVRPSFCEEYYPLGVRVRETSCRTAREPHIEQLKAFSGRPASERIS